MEGGHPNLEALSDPDFIALITSTIGKYQALGEEFNNKRN